MKTFPVTLDPLPVIDSEDTEELGYNEKGSRDGTLCQNLFIVEERLVPGTNVTIKLRSVYNRIESNGTIRNQAQHQFTSSIHWATDVVNITASATYYEHCETELHYNFGSGGFYESGDLARSLTMAAMHSWAAEILTLYDNCKQQEKTQWDSLVEQRDELHAMLNSLVHRSTTKHGTPKKVDQDTLDKAQKVNSRKLVPPPTRVTADNTLDCDNKQ